MDEAHLQELEAEIRSQYALLGRLRTAVMQQEERLAALRRELEMLRQLLAEDPRDAQEREQNELPL